MLLAWCIAKLHHKEEKLVFSFENCSFKGYLPTISSLQECFAFVNVPCSVTGMLLSELHHREVQYNLLCINFVIMLVLQCLYPAPSFFQNHCLAQLWSCFSPRRSPNSSNNSVLCNVLLSDCEGDKNVIAIGIWKSEGIFLFPLSWQLKK